jgi:hypothetical protein
MTLIVTLVFAIVFFIVALAITAYWIAQQTEQRATRRAIVKRLERLFTEEALRMSVVVSPSPARVFIGKGKRGA